MGVGEGRTVTLALPGGIGDALGDGRGAGVGGSPARDGVPSSSRSSANRVFPSAEAKR